MNEQPTPARVIVTDVNIRFGSLVGLLVKLALAAIPALLILGVIGAAAFVFLSALFSR